MPLKALVNGKRVISIDCSDEDWSEIKEKKSKIEMICCGGIGNQRVSKLGTKHFYHKPNADCNWQGESREHLRMKEIIYITCQKEGWKTEIEYTKKQYFEDNNGDSTQNDEDWQIDVFASKNDKKIAFEVQWSPQNKDETERRQKKYKDDGISGIWLFKKIPTGFDKAVKETPCFELDVKETSIDGVLKRDFFVKVGGKSISLEDFVSNILNKNIRFRTKLSYCKTQIADVYKFPWICYRCGKKTEFITVYSLYSTQCGLQFKSMSIGTNDLGSALSKEQQFGNPLLTDVGKIRYIKSNGYWANTCKSCSAMMGYHYLRDDTLMFLCEDPTPKPKLQLEFNTEPKIIDNNYPHWCLKSDDGFCAK